MPLTKLKESPTINKVVLVGFMGCGKTTISLELGKILAQPLYNIDNIIKFQEKKTIEDIFFHKGERYFRDLEVGIIESLVKNSTGIIDCGGGVVEEHRNMTHLRSWGKVFWLDCPLEMALSRLTEKSDRPLLLNKTPEEMQLFYSRRVELYKEYSHHRIDSSREIPIIIKEITEILNKGC